MSVTEKITKLNFLLKAIVLSSFCTLLTTSCEYKLPKEYDSMEEGREKDAITYRFYYKITYGDKLYVNTDTLTLAGEPDGEKRATLEKGAKIEVVDLVKIEKEALDAWGKPYKGKFVCAKVKYEGGEGYQYAAQIVKNTNPDNWMRFLPDLSLKQSIWTVAISIVVFLLYYFTERRRGKKLAAEGIEDDPELLIMPYILGLLAIVLAITYIGLSWGDDIDLMKRYFWSWSLHPFMAKVFVVTFVLLVVSVVGALIEIISKKKTPLKIIWSIIGVTACVTMIFSLVLLSFILIMGALMLIFGFIALTSWGKGAGGAKHCGKCGTSYHGDRCPNC